MTHSIDIPDAIQDKDERYALLLSQVKSLIEGETDPVAINSNVIAALHTGMGFFWTGIYIVRGEELVLGPFQGPVACVRIGFDKGVCGKAWAIKDTVIVQDVEQFPGHIACNAASKSEIVIPVVRNGAVTMVLDVDSDVLNSFDATDAFYLKQLSGFLKEW